MDCELSKNNALMLDKLLSSCKSEHLVINSSENIKLQSISENRDIVCNITLESSFFEFFQSRNHIIKINTPRFHYPNMSKVQIKYTKSFLVFEYEYINHIHRHKYIIFEAEIYSIDFNIRISEYINHRLLEKVINQISGTVKFEFRDEMCHITKDNTKLSFHCPGFVTVKFEINVKVLRNILNNADSFDACLINWESEESPLNINLYGVDMSVGYYLVTG